MKLQVSALLLAGCLALASADLPKHPFFSGTPMASAAGVESRYGYEDGGYDAQHLCLQGKTACFGEGPDDLFDFVLGVDCCKDPHHHKDAPLLGMVGNTGYCVMDQSPMPATVPGAGVDIFGTFTAMCWLHDSAPGCNLGKCENSVIKVEGVTMVKEDVIFETNPEEPLDTSQCNNNRRSTNKAEKLTWAKWGENVAKRVGREAPAAGAKKSTTKRNTNTPEVLYRTLGAIWTGIASTYDGHGKLIGTGTFTYNVPLPFDEVAEITPAEAAGKPRYTPQQIEMSVHPIKSEHRDYHN